MQIDKTITFGNVISWVMISAGLVAGYVRLENASSQNTKDVLEAKEMAQRVDIAQRSQALSQSTQIHLLTVDVAVTKNTVGSMDKKIDELIRKSNER